MKKPHIPHICTIADPFVILLRTRSGRGVDHRPWPYPRASINHDSVTELCTDTTSYGHPHPHDRSSFKVIPGGGREASGVGRSPVFPPTDKGDVRCGRFLKFCKLEIWFFFGDRTAPSVWCRFVSCLWEKRWRKSESTWRNCVQQFASHTYDISERTCGWSVFFRCSTWKFCEFLIIYMYFLDFGY